MRRTAALFFVVLAVAALVAPEAMADHCFRCRFVPSQCYPALHHPGRTECYQTGSTCELNGLSCAAGTFAPAPDLASEYVVVSVERLDETPRAGETVVATLRTPAIPRE